VVTPASDTVTPASDTGTPVLDTVTPASDTVRPASDTVTPAPDTVTPASDTVTPVSDTVTSTSDGGMSTFNTVSPASLLAPLVPMDLADEFTQTRSLPTVVRGPLDPVVIQEDPFPAREFIPEPENNPIVEVDVAVQTAEPDFVQWRATMWGGAMTDNDLLDTMTGQDIRLEDSGFFGLGVSRTLGGGNSIQIEGELQLLHHLGKQDHIEGTAALALRWEMSPSFSVALVQGMSYATALPEIEDENNTDESQFLHYMAFEAEYSFTPKWALAARLHHRSGAGGIYGNAIGGSNAYLMGIRYRF
jgi:hypothetical protein